GQGLTQFNYGMVGFSGKMYAIKVEVLSAQDAVMRFLTVSIQSRGSARIADSSKSLYSLDAASYFPAFISELSCHCRSLALGVTEFGNPPSSSSIIDGVPLP
ncbi:1769_t:CDS:2, partial [Acaulospora morrowiae]